MASPRRRSVPQRWRLVVLAAIALALAGLPLRAGSADLQTAPYSEDAVDAAARARADLVARR